MLITTARSRGKVIGISSKIPRWEDLRKNYPVIEVEHFLSIR